MMKTRCLFLVVTGVFLCQACGKTEDPSAVATREQAKKQNEALIERVASAAQIPKEAVPAYLERENGLLNQAETLHLKNDKGHGLVVKFYQRPTANGRLRQCASIQTPRNRLAIELSGASGANGQLVYTGKHGPMQFALVRQGSGVLLTENGKASLFQPSP